MNLGDLVEEWEFDDWSTQLKDSNQNRHHKSMQAYWLNRWYNKVEHLTFRTKFYDEIPNQLPFSKCMIRYESKSPKDSEYWGPTTNSEQAKLIFYTSLRCKTNPGNIFCFREWTDLEEREYRCFWNGRLMAVSADSIITKPPIDQIINYVNSIEQYIPFHRCVFDLAHLKTISAQSKDTNNLVLVEFNSWETNSGAHLFDWRIDSEHIYNFDGQVAFRYKIDDNEIKTDLVQVYEPVSFQIDSFCRINQVVPLEPHKQSNWLIHKQYLYVTNDIWLCQLSLNEDTYMKPLNWKRGVFRFSELELQHDLKGNTFIVTVNGPSNLKPSIYREDLKLMDNINVNNLKPLNSKLNEQIIDPIVETKLQQFKYGFLGKVNSEFVFCKLLYDGSFFIKKL
jgi:hypothetical protein